MIHQENFFLRESAKEHFSRKPSSDNPTLDILNGAAEERRGAFAGEGTKVAGFQLGERGKFMERELERPRERATGQENFPDDFSLRLVPIFFVMWRAKNEQRRKGIGRGELESRAWDGMGARGNYLCTHPIVHGTTDCQ